VEHPAKRRHITELPVAGWTVHVDQSTVTVPQQDLTGKAIQDLGYCLHRAYVLAQVRISSRPGEDTPTVVAYATLIRALRSALPPHTTLTEYSDQADRAAICQLYARAAAIVGCDSQLGAART
jgi:hypothetical protein